MKKEQQILINAMVLSGMPKIIAFSAMFTNLTEGVASAMTLFASALVGKPLEINENIEGFFDHEIKGLVLDGLNSMNQHGEVATNAYIPLLESKILSGELTAAFSAANAIESLILGVDFAKALTSDQVLAILSLKESIHAEHLSHFNQGFEPILDVIQKDIDDADAKEESKKVRFIDTLKENDCENLKKHLEEGEDIHQIINTHDKPISIAAAHNSSDVVSLLLAHGAIPHAHFPNNSAFKKAIENNNTDIVNRMLTHGHEVFNNIKEKDYLPWSLTDEYVDLMKLFIDFNLDINLTSLAEKSVNDNHTKLLALYLNNGIDPNKEETSNNLAVIALKKGNIDALTLLIEHNVEVNTLDFFSNSLLAIAIEEKNIPAIQLLLEKKAKLLCREYYNVSSAIRELATLLDIPFTEALKLNLIQEDSESNNYCFMHFAAESESFGVPELTVLVEDLKMDVNAVNQFNNGTPLTLTEDKDKMHYLISQGADVNYIADGKPIIFSIKESLVPFFIESGADINTVFEGESLLHRALSYRSNYLGLLLTKGVDVNVKDNNGRTPLEWNIHHVEYLTPYMEAFIAAGVDLEKTTREGVPLLTVVCCLYGADAINKASEIGAIINKTDANKNTMIMHACIAGNVEGVEALAKLGVDINQVNILGVAPLMHAIAQCNIDMVKALISHGADTTIEIKGRDAISLARELGNTRLVPLMKKLVYKSQNGTLKHQQDSEKINFDKVLDKIDHSIIVKNYKNALDLLSTAMANNDAIELKILMLKVLARTEQYSDFDILQKEIHGIQECSDFEEDIHDINKDLYDSVKYKINQLENDFERTLKQCSTYINYQDWQEARNELDTAIEIKYAHVVLNAVAENYNIHITPEFGDLQQCYDEVETSLLEEESQGKIEECEQAIDSEKSNVKFNENEESIEVLKAEIEQETDQERVNEHKKSLQENFVNPVELFNQAINSNDVKAVNKLIDDELEIEDWESILSNNIATINQEMADYVLSKLDLDDLDDDILLIAVKSSNKAVLTSLITTCQTDRFKGYVYDLMAELAEDDEAELFGLLIQCSADIHFRSEHQDESLLAKLIESDLDDARYIELLYQQSAKIITFLKREYYEFCVELCSKLSDVSFADVLLFGTMDDDLPALFYNAVENENYHYVQTMLEHKVIKVNEVTEELTQHILDVTNDEQMQTLLKSFGAKK